MFCLVLAAALAFGGAVGAHGDASVSALLSTVEANMKDWGINTARSVFNDAGLLRQIPEFKALETAADTSWRDTMKEVAPATASELSKAVVFLSFESLSPENYLSFLAVATDGCDHGQISTDLLRHALSPAGKLHGLLASYHQDNRVAALITRWKVIFRADADLQRWFADILAGRAKQDLKEYEEEISSTLPAK